MGCAGIVDGSEQAVSLSDLQHVTRRPGLFLGEMQRQSSRCGKAQPCAAAAAATPCTLDRLVTQTLAQAVRVWKAWGGYDTKGTRILLGRGGQGILETGLRERNAMLGS